MNHHIQV